MPLTTYVLSATLARHSGTLSGLRVEAWDAAELCPDLIDVAASDAKGGFTMRIDAATLKELLPRRKPAVVFRVFDQDGKNVPLAKEVTWEISTRSTKLQIPLGSGSGGSALAPAPLTVRGTVRDADGKAVPDAVVHAVDRHLSGTGLADTPLGHAPANARGEYTIHYRTRSHTRVKPDLVVWTSVPEAPAPDPEDTAPLGGTVVTIGDAVSTTAVRVESKMLSPAPATARVDLGAGTASSPRVSELRRILKRLAPVLAQGHSTLPDLTKEAIAHAARAAKVRLDRVVMAKQAALMARGAGGAVPAEVFYGLLRMGYHGGLAQLAATPAIQQRRRLVRAIRGHVIAETFRSQLDELVAALQQIVVDRELPADATRTTGISTLLAHSLSSRDTQRAFLSSWTGRKRNGRHFWSSVRNDPALAPAATDLELTLRLGMLFDDHQPALADLKTQRQAGGVTSLRDLAGWEDGDWQAFVGRIGGAPAGTPGATPEERTTNYVAGLRKRLHRYHPTESLRRRARAPRDPISLRFVPALAAANPDLDPKQPLPDEPAWGDIAETDREAARAEWTAFRREALTFRGVPARSLLDATVTNAGRNPVREAANAVFTASDLDLDREGIEAYLARKPETLSAVDPALRAPVVEHLKTSQRLLRVAGEPEAVETLMASGLDSAFRIARLSRQQFVDRYASALGGEAQAHATYTRSFHTAATAQLALTTTAQSLVEHSVSAVRAGGATTMRARHQSVLDLLKKKTRSSGAPAPDPEDDDPAASWPVLFGEQAWCDCEHCQSVFGPAAYLVDLLHTLDPADEQKNAAHYLFKRRPDLPHLKLTCENTNTTIPSVDLVNEILETYIDAQDHPAVRRRAFDTGDLTSAELRALPQNVNDRVYDKLAGEVYPFTLPFHRPLAVARAYLEQLGTSYREVLETLGPAEGTTELTAEERLSAETLGLSTLEFLLIAGASTTTTAACYGFADDDATWQSEIADVPELLRRTGVSYEDLLALVKTFFVNPLQFDPARRIELDAPVAGVLEGTRVHRAGADAWSRLHRFIRLWRASGWSIPDLDRVLFAVTDPAEAANPDQGREVLRRAGLVKRVTEELNRPLASLLALWSDIDTWGADALYLERFRNRTVVGAEDADSFELDYPDTEHDPPDPEIKPESGLNELAGTADLLADHVPTILSALRVSETDLDLIWDHAISVEALADRETETLGLHSLTVLYRYTVLAKAVGLRIADLITLLALSGVDPFQPHHPAPVRAFAELAAKFKASGFSMATLDYLIRHTIIPAQGPAPADSEVIQALMKVWAALRAVRQETEVIDDPDGTVLRARLATVHPPDVVSSIMDALDPDPEKMSDDERGRIFTDHLVPYLGSPLPSPLTADVVLAGLSAWMRDEGSRSAVVSVVAESLGLDDALALRLLDDWIPGDAPDETALDTFLDLAAGGLRAERFDAAGSSTLEDGAVVDLSVTSTSTPRRVHWTGQLLPLGDGDHVFILRTNGAVTLQVGDSPTTTWPAEAFVVDHELTVTLAADTLAAIRVEYDAGDLGGSVQLLWRLADQPAAVPIPPENLFLPAPDGLAVLDDAATGPGFTWRRLHKAALLSQGFSFTEEELDYSEGGAPFGGFLLRTLPMSVPDNPALHLRRWVRLADFAALRASLPNAETTLIDVFLAHTPPADPDADEPSTRAERWAALLCEATGWDPATVVSLFDRAAVQDHEWTLRGDQVLARLLTRVAGPVADPQDLEIGRRLSALADGLKLVRRIGVDPTSWTRREPTAAIAAEVVQAVRGRYDEESDWLEVARTRNDPLREKQRDALVAYLLTRMTIGDHPPVDANELFEYFLIDVEMAACFQTSRIKQAISSVQLFIQRILLGLEKPDVEPSVIDADRWPWMSRYRVWEANRKIFLYPENWIEPELRTTKSPFFEELESALKQGPLEDTNVEDAFVAYLGKVDDVSRLHVMAIHQQKETDEEDPDNDIDILHVVARTTTMPVVFYYRQLVNGSEWTAWEKIDVDIETEENGGVHMALTTHDRRLFLFWAKFTEKPEDEQPGANEGESPPPPLTHWEIKLSWSTYRNGAWSPKRVSAGSIDSDRFIDELEEAEANPEPLEDFKDQVADLKQAWDDAEDKVGKKETTLWNTLQTVRDDLWDRIETVVTAGGNIQFPGDILDELIHNFLSPLFYYEPSDFPELENWISGENKDFEQFIDDIYDFPGDEWAAVVDVPDYSVKKSEVNDQHQKVKDARQTRNQAEDDYEAMNKALEDFEDGKSALPIPDLVRRRDHTLWVTNGDTVIVSVMRRTGSGQAEKIGTFTLSDDHHAMEADELKVPRPTIDLSQVTPEHSVPRSNGYRITTHDDEGLDLPDLPNLLGEVYDTQFLGEHNFHAHVTGSDPRPFFISKDSDCHLALPVAEPRTYEAVAAAGGEAKSRYSMLTSAGAMSGAKSVFELPQSAAAVTPGPIFRFQPFHHPFTRSLIKRLNRDGIDGLLTVKSQNPSGEDDGGSGGHFDTTFKPDPDLVESFSPYDIDFRADGAYSVYNWELFFHAPFLIAVRLMQDQRYEEARDWFHYIFDPTTDGKAEVPKRYWRVQPLRDNDDYSTADQFLTALCDPDASTELRSSVEAQLDQWMRYPADPHRIAALRPSAYQKAVVFRYLDNLIAWGDSLFMQDTIESINEATQLYVLAGHLLGPRPENVPKTTEVEPLDYAAMRDSLDDLSNLLVDVESLIFPFGSGSGADHRRISSLLGISHLPVKKVATLTTTAGGDEQTLYFCVPGNDKLLGYWDTVEDRLFKIRHCMNIAGVERQLALFEPPIDPALLVRAAAAGLDIGSVLSDLSAPLPRHRFPLVLQKALELCGEVKSLGSQLLSALEKKDAEHLALLRATHEKALLTAVRDVRAKQLAEAKAARVALDKTETMVQARHDYYASREKVNVFETVQLTGMLAAAGAQFLGSMLSLAASAAAVIPDFDVGGTGMGVHGTAKYGGAAMSEAIGYTGEAISHVAQAAQTGASAAGILGGHERRMDDWKHQADLAKKELAQIRQQQVAADIRIEIAEREQANTEKQLENAAEVEEVLRDKYTNEELYGWMITRVSEVYYQAYKLAYDLAKRAERCFRFETGQESSSFIQFGYWDSLRKGLLAGEQLALSLKRLDAAYLEAARRDYEITRQVSLVLHDPEAFIALRETGECEVDLPEELFDADYPGHYFRRLKTVSLTLPCVAGPYTPINCTLTLLSSRVRTSSSAAGEYPESDAPNDERFSRSFGAIQSVATSHGQNDSGLFEVSFRDERYLPFEGAGAISRWKIQLRKDCNAFDFDTLSDVILRVSYTARDGGSLLADAALLSLKTRRGTPPEDVDETQTPTTPLGRLFRVRYEFSDAWIAFTNALAGGAGPVELTLDIDKERFPFLYRGATITVVGLRAWLTLTDGSMATEATLGLTTGGGTAGALTFGTTGDPTLLASNTVTCDDDAAGAWKLTADPATFPIGEVKDLLILLTYTAAE